MGNILDLNDSISQESQFVDVPEGEYDARIDHVDSGLCQWDGDYNGNPMRSVRTSLCPSIRTRRRSNRYISLERINPPNTNTALKN